MAKRRYKKLTPRQQRLASKYIAEEMRARDGRRRKPRTKKQAVAIGISRARAATKNPGEAIERLMRKYRVH